jgi:hypothetical protein
LTHCGDHFLEQCFVLHDEVHASPFALLFQCPREAK